MAGISNIKLNPAQMEEKAVEFLTRNGEFGDVVTRMRNMVTALCDEWEGQSSQAFSEQFNQLEPSFTATSNLIQSIAQQLRDVSGAMQDIDQEIAGKIGAK